MRYQSLPQTTPAMLRGPRGRTRTVLASVFHGTAGLSATTPAPKEKTWPVRPAVPVDYYETATTSRLAG